MPASGFPAPRENRYFEDYVVGSVHEFGPIAVTEEEMTAFAARYDPQAFHIDPEAAKKTRFGGLIASGWFTAALAMRLWVENVLSRVASQGSPGVNKLRWIVPVRPGDELSMRVKIRGARRSRSKPDWGVVDFFVEVKNQNGEVVMTLQTAGLFLRREKSI
jgi:acyl dehydratase